MSDPRDNGFNYGRGWGSSSKPPIYLEAMRECRRLNQMVQAASKKAWTLEMACWRVRVASTATEKRLALDTLHALYNELTQPVEITRLPAPGKWTDA